MKRTTPGPEDSEDGLSLHRWSVILGGAEGGSRRPWSGVWDGKNCPKQFCALAGKRSTFEETVERARQISTFDRILTVLCSDQVKCLPLGISSSCGQIIEQPANRETAAAILVCAAWAMATDPHATLLVLSSEHGVYTDKDLTPQLMGVIELAEELDDKIILLGSEMNSAERGHGWILTARATDVSKTGVPFRTVVGLDKGPESDKAKRFYGRGYLWNTAIFAAKATTLWNLSREFLPELTERFQMLRRVREVARFREGRPDLTMQALKHIYGNIPALNFSQELLSKATRHVVVFPMREVVWSS